MGSEMCIRDRDGSMVVRLEILEDYDRDKNMALYLEIIMNRSGSKCRAGRA